MSTRRLLGVASVLTLGSLAACTNAMSPPPPMAATPAPTTTAMVTDPMVGGAAMYPTKNIVENAMASPDHTTLVAAVKAAGLVSTLEGPGPFTVFAPTNEAFDALQPGTLQRLLQPRNKARLTAILTYHVVPGMYDMKAIRDLIDKGNGRAILRTVNGHTLTLVPQPGGLTVIDDHGGSAIVSIPDVYQSNGVIFVVNKVLMP
jgi:uncharacterized surface protein with fasciclin (FAS1) repeats